MTFFFFYALSLLILVLLPIGMFLSNLRIFRRASRDDEWLRAAAKEKISILIPARNEESSIAVAIDRILDNRQMHFELIVLDDQSDDGTPTVVRDRMQKSAEVRLIEAIPLPEVWNGKQHACWRLAQAAQFDWLLFLDADVRLSEQAIQRIVAEGMRSKVSLLSGFPNQETGSLAEKMLIPMMHFILLGYLPIGRMRATTSPSLSAGCGQLMLARRDAYFACDGHRAIRASRHDGIQLPRAFRERGFATDIFDAGDIAVCRMYRNRREVVVGLLKNAKEGMANGHVIFTFTILLSAAAVLPIPSLIIALWTQQSRWTIAILALASLGVFVPRLLAVVRFHQSILGALLHPIGVGWFLGLQWLAWLRDLRGQRVAWRGRFQ